MHQPRPHKPHGAPRAPGASIRPGHRGSRRERPKGPGAPRPRIPSLPRPPSCPTGKAEPPAPAPPRPGRGKGHWRLLLTLRRAGCGRRPSGRTARSTTAPSSSPSHPAGSSPSSLPAGQAGPPGPPGTKGRHSLMAAQGRAMLATGAGTAPARHHRHIRPPLAGTVPARRDPAPKPPCPRPREAGSALGSPCSRGALGGMEEHRQESRWEGEESRASTPCCYGAEKGVYSQVPSPECVSAMEAAADGRTHLEHGHREV